MNNNTTSGLRSLLRAAASVVATIAVMIMLIVVLTPPAANAETPAERCKRETTAYNNAWKNTWAQANPGRKPSDAPPPPVPYKCGGNNDGPPPSTAPTEPNKDNDQEPDETPPATQNKENGSTPTPGLNPPTDRRELEHPEPGQPAIDPDDSPTRQGRSTPQGGTPQAAHRTVTIPTENGHSILTAPSGVYLRSLKADGELVISVLRNAGSNANVIIGTQNPVGSRWVDAGPTRAALIDALGRRVAVLNLANSSTETGVGVPSRLHGTGDGLRLDVTAARGTPTISELLAPLRKPATANGCTTGQGPTGTFAHNCHSIYGSGTTVDRAFSQYYYSQPVGPSVCERHHEFMYTEASGRTVRRQVNPGGCINSGAMVATGDFVELPGTPLHLKDGSMFCTRVKNSATNDRWSPWACNQIKA